MVTTILADGTQALAKAGAIMKRLQSTETLGLDLGDQLGQDRDADAEPDDRGRRWRSSAAGTRSRAGGYSTAGQITRVGGQAEIPLDQFLLPMVLASDAVLRTAS